MWASTLFLRIQKKAMEALNSVSKLYGFKPTNKYAIEVTALNLAIEHLETLREDILSNFPLNSFSKQNPAIDRFQKSNDEIIQLDEQAACYTLFEAIKGVKLLTKDEETNNTSKEILKELERFEHNIEKIIRTVETELIDKKRQSLLTQHAKREANKVTDRLHSEISDETSELLRLAPDLVKAELSSTVRVNIRVSADIQTAINKLRLKGFFHPIKDRPKSNFYLANLSDKEIIKHYNSIMMGLLNWFSGADKIKFYLWQNC